MREYDHHCLSLRHSGPKGINDVSYEGYNSSLCLHQLYGDGNTACAPSNAQATHPTKNISAYLICNSKFN